MEFLKGHGTGNDFVLLPDGAGRLDLSAERVRRLCDRRFGIGADGVLRAVLAANDPDAAAMAGDAQWFMDYRNANGSVAQMCGNGARLFARYLVDAGLAAPGEIAIATRSGVVAAHADRGGAVRVTLGPYELPSVGPITVRVTSDGSGSEARAVLMPNPHVVVSVADLDAAGDLVEAPQVQPPTAFPDGVNVEFALVRGERHIAMRVHERGAGETYSCGTGAAAVAVVQAQADGLLPAADGEPVTYVVDVRGGRLEVTVRPDRRVDLCGPAVIVAEGTVELDAL